MTAPIPAWIDGALTPVDKLAAHRRGLLHKAVSVFVMCGSDVLLQRRAMAKYHTPGLWTNTCCTHPRWGEAPEACAHRRLEEELGLTGLHLDHRERATYRADVGGGLTENERVDIFLARLRTPMTPCPDPAEVMETAWVSMAALEDSLRRAPERFTPWLRIYLERHGERIFA